MWPERLLLEKREMARRFPQFELYLTDGYLSWVGKLETNRGHSYRLDVRYPDDFPYKAPLVYPIDPPIEACIDEGNTRFKHQYPDGHLCLFYPGDKTFSPRTTAAAVVAVAAAWLFAYESWLESGRTDWPGQEAPDIPLEELEALSPGPGRLRPAPMERAIPARLRRTAGKRGRNGARS
jgi:hypothetical protein